MQREDIFTMKSIYRDSFRIRAYRFGGGEKSICIVGAMRGNEHQQLFTASRLIRRLAQLEEEGRLTPGKEIMVIPCGNPYSMNIGKRFWTIDNTDINRMFPGYDQGETTQRIAAGIFQEAMEYRYGIQFASFYMRGTFAPHVRMMETGFEDVDMARKFGLPYVLIRRPRPFDTTTLNYNWQIWNTSAFSIYTTGTDQVDSASARQAVEAIVRFLVEIGLVRENDQDKDTFPPMDSAVVYDENLLTLRTDRAGFFNSFVKPGEAVEEGQLLAQITDPYEGTLRSRIVAPAAGQVLFMHQESLIYADSSVFKLVAGLDGESAGLRE